MGTRRGAVLGASRVLGLELPQGYMGSCGRTGGFGRTDPESVFRWKLMDAWIPMVLDLLKQRFLLLRCWMFWAGHPRLKFLGSASPQVNKWVGGVAGS